MTVRSPDIAPVPSDNSGSRIVSTSNERMLPAEKPYIFAGNCDTGTRTPDGEMTWQKKPRICTRNLTFT